MKQKIFAMLVIIIFTTTIFPSTLGKYSFNNLVENKTTNDFAILEKNDEYTSHEPIRIYGDDDFTQENGVTSGSGSEADPFMIENWNVSYIRIDSTTKFFVINHCYINLEGIAFWYISDGKIKDCKILQNGIDFIESNNNFIEDCFISCFNNDLEEGIDFSNSNYNTIYKCTIENCCYGLYLSGRSGSNNNIISCCNISNCIGGGGIRIGIGKNNQIYHNNFMNNYYELSTTVKARCNAVIDGGINIWDNGEEGNYWDNYLKIKLPRLYDWNNDEIGEIPYRIFVGPFFPLRPSFNKDRHPLMKPYSEI